MTASDAQPTAHGDVERPIEGTPSDNTTLTAVLEQFADLGFDEQFVVNDDGSVECGGCGSTAAPAELRFEHTRRLEGASDPDDMLSVVAARCPTCGHGGTIVMGYGPNASAGDAAVARSVAESARSTGGSSGPSGGPTNPPDTGGGDPIERLDPDSPGRSVLDPDGAAVEPNEPA
ncbi:MAG TPA: hypothetical protein VGK49_08975 [Ilumatobacteraceae bacterium]